MDSLRCVVSAALTINTLTSVWSLESFKSRWIIGQRDLKGWGKNLVEAFERRWLHILKRIALFEVILCIILLCFCTTPPVFYNTTFKLLLFLPQAILLLFFICTEVVLFSVLCAKNSFKNGRPYWVATIEFIFIFVLFGIVDILFPSLFDYIGQKAFEKTKTLGPIDTPCLQQQTNYLDENETSFHTKNMCPKVEQD